MPENRPWMFGDLASLHSETQLYTARRSDAENPAEAKFTLQDIVDYLTANHNLGSGGGSGDTYTRYDAGNGCMVEASASGVTFARTSATEGDIDVPAGVKVRAIDIVHTSAQNPGNSYYLKVTYNETGLDLKKPRWIGVSNNLDSGIARATPIRNFIQGSGGTFLDTGITELSGTGSTSVVEYSVITGYNGQVGAGESIFSVLL